MGKRTDMGREAAARIQSAAARDPESPTAESGPERGELRRARMSTPGRRLRTEPTLSVGAD